MSALAGRAALVTGRSRGIGAAIARRFAQEGAGGVVHGRDPAALAAVVAGATGTSGNVRQVTGDVTKFADLEAMRAEIEDAFGPVDILVANAGGSFTMPGPLDGLSEEGWRSSVEGNLTATFLTIKCFL